MGVLNLGRVRGTFWYTGDGITGTDTTGTIFPSSGVEHAYEGDLFMNLSHTESSGCVYSCSKAGDPTVAEWVYSGRMSVQVDIVDDLNSSERDKALSARQGRVLREMIESGGIAPVEILPKTDTVAHTAYFELKNEAATITLETYTGETGTINVTPAASGSTNIVIATIGPDIGISTSGAAIREIRSTLPINDYRLYDENGEVITQGVPSIWTRVNEAEENVRTGANITDGEEVKRQGIISKMVGGTREQVWPETHAKATWYDKANGITVFDELDNKLVPVDPGEITDPIDFESADITLTPDASQAVELLSDGDLWDARFYKISQMFQNVRYLLNRVNYLVDRTTNYALIRGTSAVIDIPANSYTVTDVTFEIPTGYRTEGIVRAFVTNGSAMVYNAFNPSANVITVHTKNLTNSALSNLNLYVQILFVKL